MVILVRSISETSLVLPVPWLRWTMTVMREGRHRLVHPRWGPIRVSPNPVPKAVDKSLNKPVKAHACWAGGVCLKKQQLLCSVQAHQFSL